MQHIISSFVLVPWPRQFQFSPSWCLLRLNSVSSTLVYLNEKEMERESVFMSEGQREREIEWSLVHIRRNEVAFVSCHLLPRAGSPLVFLTVERNREQETCVLSYPVSVAMIFTQDQLLDISFIHKQELFRVWCRTSLRYICKLVWG
jgi:hypothetical protein